MPNPRASAAHPIPEIVVNDPAPPVAAGARVSVLLPLPLGRAYDYAVPADMTLEPGALVRVPLGGREAVGVVWDREAGPEEVPASRLRPVIARLHIAPMDAARRRFIEWVASYTMASRGAVLRMALSVPAALEPPRPTVGYRLAPRAPDSGGPRRTAARARVLAALAQGAPRPMGDLTGAARAGASVVKGLVRAGLLEAVALPPAPAFTAPDPTRAGPALSRDQVAAAAVLTAKAAAGAFDVTLLDGVTGSGKTEVYFEAIAAALARGRQALVLLPEIALSPQWLERFEVRFGAAPALWHSDLSEAQRRIAWRAVASGAARVVVGARSALFLPFAELGLIVVDEEHDAGFKQEDGVIYHARDMAVVRARLGACAVVLVSATPSLETVTNVRAGRYGRVHLAARHAGAALPAVELIDLRADRPPRVPALGQGWLSTRLSAAVDETLKAGEQAMLFLNRRGYAPLTLCRACGHRLQCPNCTAWLVEHRRAGTLLCHHCGHRAPLPTACPGCGAEGALAACGPGVERLAEEVAALFPAARTAIMASDTLAGPAAAAALVRAVQAREIDLLIGTQIVAKGHHFPHLTLVGVVDADLGLYGGDLRAAERTFQLLHQVSGRAGRAARPGRVLIQTAEPEHPVMSALAAGARDRFMDAESEARARSGMPPFGRLAALILSARDPAPLDAACRALTRAAPRRADVRILGPAPAPLAILRGRHRRRFLLKTPREVLPQGVIQAWLGALRLPSSVRVRIDIDPYSFL